MAEVNAEQASLGEQYLKETVIDGVEKKIRCIDIDGQTYKVSGSLLKLIELEDDWFEDVERPEHVISVLVNRKVRIADGFSFWQRPPNETPKYSYHMKQETIAVLPISTYDRWLNDQINSKTRNMVRKSEKRGVTTTVSNFDDSFVEGMTLIFNESPLRQDRPFWHYGKDKETIRRQFSRYLSREVLIRADFEGQMVGLVMLGNAGDFAIIGQVISSLRHRDKAVNNALIAKSVEVCAQKGWSSLCYYYWGDDSLTAFKRSCGFQAKYQPRYFVPLTRIGQLALAMRLQHGLRAYLPKRVEKSLKALRNRWNRSIQ